MHRKASLQVSEQADCSLTSLGFVAINCHLICATGRSLSAAQHKGQSSQCSVTTPHCAALRHGLGETFKGMC